MDLIWKEIYVCHTKGFLQVDILEIHDFMKNGSPYEFSWKYTWTVNLSKVFEPQGDINR